MTGKEIIAMCSKIIKRQDLDTDLLLLFLNQQRKVVMRNNYLYKLDEWQKGFQPVDGFALIPNLKQARYVEYSLNDTRKELFRLNSFTEALQIYSSIDEVGEPIYYIIMSGGMKIIPAPPEGTINIYGEFYPADIANDNVEDTLCKELSDAIIYLGCAEYFDMLAESSQAEFWRNKGLTMIESYISEIKKQMTDDKNLLARDPFGNLGMVHGRQGMYGEMGVLTGVFTIDELTGGDI